MVKRVWAIGERAMWRGSLRGRPPGATWNPPPPGWMPPTPAQRKRMQELLKDREVIITKVDEQGIPREADGGEFTFDPSVDIALLQPLEES